MKKGYWEQKGRSTAFAAFLMIGLIGGLYFTFGSFAANGFTIIDMLVNRGRPASTDIIRHIIETYRRYQIPVLTITVIFQFLFFFGLTAIVFRNWHGRSVTEYFRIRAVNPLIILVAAFGGIALIPLVNATGDFFMRFFPIFKRFEEAGNVLVTVHAPWQWVFLIFAIGVTPAVCEEFLFRGYFHRTLERTISAPGVYFLSGMIFALIHQNYFGLVALILVGSYLGFVYQRGGSIFVSAATHFAYNTSLILLVNIPAAGNIIMKADGTTRWQAVIASAVLGAAAVIAMHHLTRGNKELPAVQRTRSGRRRNIRARA